MIILKEDSLDDIIRAGHSDYYDTLISFLEKNKVNLEKHITVSGGKFCYVEKHHDEEPRRVVFKDPKTKLYIPLRFIEMYNDGSTFVSSKSYGGGWHSNRVPLEEIWVYDYKGKYKNYKGKSVDEDTFSKLVDYSI